MGELNLPLLVVAQFHHKHWLETDFNEAKTESRAPDPYIKALTTPSITQLHASAAGQSLKTRHILERED